MSDGEARRLRQKRKLVLTRMGKVEDFLRGSVVLMKRPCTYPGCRKCAVGERHESWVLTYSSRGKTHTVYLGQKRLAEARRMVANHRRVVELMEQISQINLLLLKGNPSRTKGGGNGGKGKGP